MSGIIIEEGRMYPADRVPKAPVGWWIFAGVMISVVVLAVSVGVGKRELVECQRWSTWTPQSHGAWAQWQIEQCKAHKITLQ